MDIAHAQALLSANGFPAGQVDGIAGPKTVAALMAFQKAWNGPRWLIPDGILGPRTSEALDGLPYLSAHFTSAEVACHHCGLAYVRRELLAALERLRTHVAGPVQIISAYRCPAHNAAIKGAKNSMHLYGLAADTPPVCTWQAAANLQVFSGIGDRAGRLAHGDLRHLSARNETPAATTTNPARWHYT